VVWWRENTLRNDPLVVASVIEVLEVALLARYHKQIEAVKDFFLGFLPISIVEVVIDPHELLIDHLWNDVFLQFQVF